ncbi:MAG: biotin transporter BioY [Chlamydiales bacterium]|nr:biotin transporter BioY [Chlamydiales bacterium]
MMYNQTLSLPQAITEKTWVRDAATVALASLLISAFAPLAITLPFSPVPIATQSHVILFIGALLGRRKGAMAVLAFLFQAAIGLPVLSGGRGGILCFVGPTAGYLVGYVVAAYVTGMLFERMKSRTPAKMFGALAIGNIAIYLFGCAHLASFLGASRAIALGVLPFLAGDLLKTLFCTQVLKKLSSFRRA